MAVATPVLERRIGVREENSDYVPERTADEIHNARIKDNYARLINPETKISDIKNEPKAETAETPVEDVPAQQKMQAPYFVESARTNADVFRADSAINSWAQIAKPETASQQDNEEEESEDLRPTLTTIQYKTTGTKKTVEEGVIANTSAEKRVNLSKRDKIIIAVVVSVIVALFVLIIVNAAIISGLNSDLGSLQSSLENVRGSYAGVSGELNDFLNSRDSILQDFVFQNNLVK